nr:immunoglobulin light chain junction region [Macaca mulatta]
CQHTYGTPSSF